MAVLGLRPRAGFLLLAVVVGHVLLISAQVNARSGVPILEAIVFSAFSELQRGASAAARGLRAGWDGYVALRQVHSENEELKRQLADAQVRLQGQQALAGRSESLERLLGLRDHVDVQTTAAEVIAASATPGFRAITIDKGSSAGLAADMAVIAPEGVVGRLVMPTPRASKVQLLIDRNAAAGAIIERSRAQGVVVGSGDAQLRMDYVSEVSDVVVGDVVLTSGIDGIFPKGFVIGRVAAVAKGRAFREIVVQPAVDFSNLEDVLVVLTPPPSRELLEVTQP
jgi:rod shape-determining protein MreC